jgi:CubicO group peptidase (beta-lactamase class C family)
VRGGKYFNDCLYSKTHKPGTYFQYVNLNFGIAGTVVEVIAKQRYDLYERDNILSLLSEGESEVATFNPALIRDTRNLGVLYLGEKGKWVPNYDFYPDGKIVQRNLTGYIIGSNGVVYGPQGSLRASAGHLTNYAIMLGNGGRTKRGKTILSAESVSEMTKPRYHYHGLTGGVLNDFHTYGLGLYSTTYRKTDTIISHEVVKGHTGSAYNLISAQHFWKSAGSDYTLTYIINGALNGYKYGTGTIY